MQERSEGWAHLEQLGHEVLTQGGANGVLAQTSPDAAFVMTTVAGQSVHHDRPAGPTLKVPKRQNDSWSSNRDADHCPPKLQISSLIDCCVGVSKIKAS